MNTIRSFHDLKVWQEGHRLVIIIYKISQRLIDKKDFGLADQIRRAAVSVPSNITEGFSRTSSKEKARFYNIAQASLAELQYQMIICRDLEYINNQEHQNIEKQVTLVRKLLAGFIRGLPTR